MHPPSASQSATPAPPGCRRCHRTGTFLALSPFTAEALCAECLRRESELLTRLRSPLGGHLDVAQEHPAPPGLGAAHRPAREKREPQARR